MASWREGPSTRDWPRAAWFKTVGAALVPLVVIMTLPLAGCRARSGPQATPNSASGLARPAPRKPSAAEQLSKKLDALQGLLTGTASRLARGRSAVAQLKSLAAIRADLDRLDQNVKTEFAATRKVLAKIGSSEKNRIQARVERENAAKMGHLTRSLASALSIRDPRAQAVRLSSLASWLDRQSPEPPHQPLGTELPHRIVDYHAGAPALGTAIAPAYAPNLANTVPSALPDTPTPEDSTQTIEVQFTSDISATANGLGRDPVKMYEFVRNTIEYEPYYGSRKGANETLWEKAGNDFDQASLLIALYRYSGIPARYVSGVVEIPIERAMNWVGVETPEAAAKLFSAAGVPTKALTSGGKIKALQIEHVWTEVYLAYESYRGLPTGSGSAKKQWVPLDPSFKRYERTAPADFLAELSSDATAQARELIDRMIVDERTGAVTGIDQDYIRSAFVEVQEEASAYAANHPELSAADIMGASRIATQALGLLPPVPPLPVRSVTSECQEAPADLRHKLTIEMPGISITRSLAEVAGRRVTVSYAVADEAEQAIVKEAGDLSAIPAYLVHGAPVLAIDGAVAAVGDSLPFASTHGVDITFSGPGTRADTVTNQLTVGSYYAATLDLGSIPGQSVSSHRDRYATAAQTLLGAEEHPDALFAPDDYMGELLHLPLLSYFTQLDTVGWLYGRLSGLAQFRMPSMAMSGVSTNVHQPFGTPLSIEPSGLFIDVDRDRIVAVSGDGDPDAVRRFAFASGLMGSELERHIWEQFHESPDSGISATKVLQLAAQDSIPIHVIDATNAPAALEALALEEGVETDIREAVAGGQTVTVPQSEVSFGSWRGAGYVIQDPQTGAVGCMLSGGTSGGEWPFQEEDSGDSAMRLIAGRALAGSSLLAAASGKVVLGIALKFLGIALASVAVNAMYRAYEACIGWLWGSKATEGLSDAQKAAFSLMAAQVFLGFVYFTIAAVLYPLVNPQVAVLCAIGQVFMGVMAGLTLTRFIPMMAKMQAGYGVA